MFSASTKSGFKLLLAVAVVGVAPLGRSQDDPTAERRDRLTLQAARWQLFYLEINGTNFTRRSPTPSPDDPNVATLEFGEDTARITGQGAVPYKLAAAKMPKEIDYGGGPTPALGIYKIENDVLFICWNDSRTDRTRPTEFRTFRDKSRAKLLKFRKLAATKANIVK